MEIKKKIFDAIYEYATITPKYKYIIIININNEENLKLRVKETPRKKHLIRVLRLFLFFSPKFRSSDIQLKSASFISLFVCLRLCLFFCSYLFVWMLCFYISLLLDVKDLQHLDLWIFVSYLYNAHSAGTNLCVHNIYQS